MFIEMKEYSHKHSADANIIVTEILQQNHNFTHMKVVWVAKSGSHIFSPDIITVKGEDYYKWQKLG